MPIIRFTGPARCTLKRIARTTRDARTLRRAQVLLDLDRGERVEDVAKRYQLSRSTVYNWVARYGGDGPQGVSEALLRDRPRSGRPPANRPRPATDRSGR